MQFDQSLNFDYEILDSFEESGNKIASVMSHNAIFVDCTYLNKDFYQIIYDLALVLKNHNYGIFVLARQQLNHLLVSMRDEMNLCDSVPEIDIVLKDQMGIYV